MLGLLVKLSALVWSRAVLAIGDNNLDIDSQNHNCCERRDLDHERGKFDFVVKRTEHQNELRDDENTHNRVGDNGHTFMQFLTVEPRLKCLPRRDA